ncbi:MAG: Mur ligase domain-containing protein, partial [Acidimicrobiales bacterium]
MNLLLDEVDVVATAGDPAAVDVQGIAHDSRRVVPGDLFCCVPGRHADGHRHAAQAVARGAVGLLCEHTVAGLPEGTVAQAVVGPGRVRPAMAQVAAAFRGHPARDLLMA